MKKAEGRGGAAEEGVVAQLSLVFEMQKENLSDGVPKFCQFWRYGPE